MPQVGTDSIEGNINYQKTTNSNGVIRFENRLVGLELIFGYSVSKRLTAEQTTIPAIQMAIKARGGKIPSGLIFHSDGGGQYYAKEFVSITAKFKLVNSLCKYP